MEDWRIPITMEDWRIPIKSGDGQSFLEIINLIKKYKPRGLIWVKGKGFEPVPYRNRKLEDVLV